MPKVELTDRFCRTAKAMNDRQTDYFDQIVKGLALLVSPGGTKTFFLHYTRSVDGKRARLNLGRYPELSLAKSREKARTARGNISEGEDPVAEKRAKAMSMIVADLVENYVARGVNSKRTCKQIARRLRKNVSAVIGDVKVADLHKRDVTRCIDKIIDRGAPGEANHVYEDARAMIRWARGRGDLDSNIMEGMRRPAESKTRDRMLSLEEIGILLQFLDAGSLTKPAERILRLCLITAQRVGEVAGMSRQELDLPNSVWTIPAGRSKNGREHIVPLSKIAASEIADQLAVIDSTSPFVFPAPKSGGHKPIQNYDIPKHIGRLLRAADDKIAHFTAHDLRRTAATHMEELGISPFVVAHVLNHVSITRASITSRVYARYDYAKEKREALDLWAEKIRRIVSDNTNH